MRRRSDRRKASKSGVAPEKAYHVHHLGFSVGSQLGEFPGEAPRRELHEGNNSHKHELLNTDKREQGRLESAAEERYELDSRNMSRL